MKYIVIKQLRCVRSWARSSATVEKLISNTRQILGWNSSINCADGPTAAFLEGLAFVATLRYCYSCWMVFGAHVELFGVRNLFFVRSCVYISALSIAILLAVLCSIVADEVEEIKMQLDITWTARPCTRKQQKMMSLFILELYHSPVELSALGFFDINRPTLSLLFDHWRFHVPAGTRSRDIMVRIQATVNTLPLEMDIFNCGAKLFRRKVALLLAAPELLDVPYGVLYKRARV
ncbi:hypothetical protein J6590_025117, partial [Homalodisca vitripennis]